jgi:serine/threonine protein kinase
MAGSEPIGTAQRSELDMLLAGTPYRMLRPLGAGGMGDVFLVEHVDLGRPLVLKRLQPQHANLPQLVERMRLEAHALGSLHHPNIVEVTDFRGVADGRPYILMEYLQGITLSDELLARGYLPVPEALELARQTLAALGAAHALGIVHRDIKPENLFLCEQPDAPRVLKVLDFGVARVLPGVSADAPAPLALPTDTGLVVGTPRYVSPEGAAGKRVDHRADIYAVGVVLYEMLVGRGPFDHLQGLAHLLAAHVSDVPEPPSVHARQVVPAELDRAVLKALAKDPADRYASAEQLEQLLAEIGERLVAAGWTPTPVVNPERAEASAPPPGVRRPIAREERPRAPARRAAPSTQVLVVIGVLVAGATAVLVALLIGALSGALRSR